MKAQNVALIAGGMLVSVLSAFMLAEQAGWVMLCILGSLTALAAFCNS